MILPLYFRPSGSGTSTMSRGTETIETVSLTLSSDATIIVSVRYVFRPTPASTPTRSTFTRGTAGVGEGLGLTVALGDADAGEEAWIGLGARQRTRRGRRRRLGEDLVGGLPRHFRRVPGVGLWGDHGNEQDRDDRDRLSPTGCRQAGSQGWYRRPVASR